VFHCDIEGSCLDAMRVFSKFRELFKQALPPSPFSVVEFHLHLLDPFTRHCRRWDVGLRVDDYEQVEPLLWDEMELFWDKQTLYGEAETISSHGHFMSRLDFYGISGTVEVINPYFGM
jgi:hypothetical protein